MLFLINKYTSRQQKQQQHHRNNNNKMVDILSPHEPPHSCAVACCPATLFLSGGGVTAATNPKHRHTTTTRAARSDFSKSTTSSFFPDTHFTSHESLPSLPSAFSDFSAAYPKYTDTHQADLIRDQHYPHLSHHVCLDYSGFGLFSHAQAPSFDISYRSASFNSQVKYGCRETALESSIKKRIMEIMKISTEDYTFICTANRTSAFRLLAESYPFRSHRRLLTVYDYESEAVTAMSDSARKKGANAMSAGFSWPSLRIHSAKLKKMMSIGSKKRRGLFAFPLQSRFTGARYPYLWMSMAQQNGWHVVLDAEALGPKDMDSLGLSLIQPDFIVCSFYKVFGADPSGFAGLFIKKASGAILESSAVATSIGVVSIVAARSMSQHPDSFSGTDMEVQSSKTSQLEQDDAERDRPISGPILCNGSGHDQSQGPSSSSNIEARGDASEPEIVELESSGPVMARNDAEEEGLQIECTSLDHADSIGLLHINGRLRYITNWLVIAMLKLRHSNSENGHSLVRIYGPRIKFDRAPALAFNVFDWKGERVEPALVQKLADRSNISLSCGFLHNICFSDKYNQQKDEFLEARNTAHMKVDNRRKESCDLGINVVNASLGFLNNFEDAYRLWVFVAKFLDADFVEKERWRYIALNQKMVEL